MTCSAAGRQAMFHATHAAQTALRMLSQESFKQLLRDSVHVLHLLAAAIRSEHVAECGRACERALFAFVKWINTTEFHAAVAQSVRCSGALCVFLWTCTTEQLAAFIRSVAAASLESDGMEVHMSALVQLLRASLTLGSALSKVIDVEAGLNRLGRIAVVSARVLDTLPFRLVFRAACGLGWGVVQTFGSEEAGLVVLELVNIFSALVALVASPPVLDVLSLLISDLAAHVDRLAVVADPAQLIELAVAPFKAVLHIVVKLELDAVRACIASCASFLQTWKVLTRAQDCFCFAAFDTH